MSTNTPVVNKWIKGVPFALILLAVGLILSYMIVNPLPATPWNAPVHENGSSIQRGLEADAARYTAMAEFYTAQEASIQRGLEADATRYTAMAQYYATLNDSIQRSLESDAARYTAMAQYYTEKEAERIQRSLEADAARYTAMAEYYTGR